MAKRTTKKVERSYYFVFKVGPLNDPTLQKLAPAKDVEINVNLKKKL